MPEKDADGRVIQRLLKAGDAQSALGLSQSEWRALKVNGKWFVTSRKVDDKARP